MQVLIVTSMLFYYVAGVPYYQLNDYNSDTTCLEAQSSGWSGRIPGCPPPAPPTNVFYPDCDACNGNQGINVQHENQQQQAWSAWSSYTKICVSRKNVCLRRCQWNVQCKTQCQVQFPCSNPSAIMSNGFN